MVKTGKSMFPGVLGRWRHQFPYHLTSTNSRASSEIQKNPSWAFLFRVGFPVHQAEKSWEGFSCQARGRKQGRKRRWVWRCLPPTQASVGQHFFLTPKHPTWVSAAGPLLTLTHLLGRGFPRHCPILSSLQHLLAILLMYLFMCLLSVFSH